MRLNLEEFAWYQKYRPKTIEECILPKNIKKIFQSIKETGHLDQDYLLSGGSGVGKTSVALALLEELGLDYIFINSSLHGNIDTLRTEMQEYASSVSFSGKRKVILLDEADNLTHATQLALRAFIEEYSSNCSYILTCNYPNRIIAGLKDSRFTEIEFVIPKQEQEEILKSYIIKSLMILKEEKVSCESTAVALICKELFPDFRKILNVLQKNAKLGKIDNNAFVSTKNEDINDLVKYLKNKDFPNTKKWVNEHSDIEPTKLSSLLYDNLAENKVLEQCLPDLILIRNKYDYQNAFVVNRILNVEAMLVEIMKDIKFK